MKNKSLVGTFSLNECQVMTKLFSQNLDFIIIDREHGSHSFEKVKTLLNSAESTCLKLVRCSHLNRIEIQRTLETNPDGLVIPQISSFDDAQKAIEYSYYAPIGSRGVSPYTEPFAFFHEDHLKKMKKINKKLFLGLLVEGKSGIESIPEICKNLSGHISLIYFGLYDFTASQGLPADWKNSKVMKVAKEIIFNCKKFNISAGSIARTKNEIATLKKIGFNFIAFQNDTGILSETLNKIKNK